MGAAIDADHAVDSSGRLFRYDSRDR